MSPPTTHLNFNIGSLPLGTSQRLMNHDTTVGKGATLALGTGTQQKGSHRGRHSEAKRNERESYCHMSNVVYGGKMNAPTQSSTNRRRTTRSRRRKERIASYRRLPYRQKPIHPGKHMNDCEKQTVAPSTRRIPLAVSYGILDRRGLRLNFHCLTGLLMYKVMSFSGSSFAK